MDAGGRSPPNEQPVASAQSSARLSRPPPLLHRHHVQPALDGDRRRRRTERARHLGRLRRSGCSCRWCSPSSNCRRAIRTKAACTSGASAPSARSPRSSPAGPYWATNLPYFPVAAVLCRRRTRLFIGGPSWQAWSSNSTYFIAASVAGLTLAVSLNILGLNIGKWLTNAGALAAWIPAGAADRSSALCSLVAVSDPPRRSTPHSLCRAPA